MSTYVEINGNRYPATISGRMFDKDWDNRESKSINIELTYEQAKELFVDDVDWSIVQENEIQEEKINEETGESTIETVIHLDTYDNSDFCVAGDIIDHRNGTITVKMGKFTAEELLAMIEEVL